MPTVLFSVSPSKQGAHHSSKTFNHTHHENGIKLLFTCKWYLGLQYLSIFYKMIDHSWRESSPDRIKIGPIRCREQLNSLVRRKKNSQSVVKCGNNKKIREKDFLHSLLTLSEYIHSSPVFNGVHVIRSLVLCVHFVDHCSSFCTFYFGHCVVCSSSIY